MANYLIDSMVWSHSRITSYLGCPYQFYLKYICGEVERPMFFSGYGSLIHELLARYYGGSASISQVLNEYLCRFTDETSGSRVSGNIKASFFEQGVSLLKALSPIPGEVLSIEEKVFFDVGDRKFIGFIDLVHRDENGALCILDHKSRDLKPRSKRAKPTKTDQELDQYLRQLYLYAIPVAMKYGQNPDFLEFNCYRTGVRIKERFCTEKLEETKQWALQTIEQISAEKEWSPNVDSWRCRHLCGLSDVCDYYQMSEG